MEKNTDLSPSNEEYIHQTYNHAFYRLIIKIVTHEKSSFYYENVANFPYHFEYKV